MINLRNIRSKIWRRSLILSSFLKIYDTIDAVLDSLIKEDKVKSFYNIPCTK